MPQENELASWLETERGDVILLHGICAIGRGDHNNIILNTSAVSRHHAVIHERDSEFWIVDLGGVNGIQVNGRRVFQPVRLQTGDRILFPSALFIFKQGVLPVPVESQPHPEAKIDAVPEVIAPAPEPGVELVDLLEEPTPDVPTEVTGKKLRGRKKRRAAIKVKKSANASALVTQKIELPREIPAVSIAPPTPKIVEEKKEPPKPFAFELAPAFPMPEFAELSPATIIAPSSDELDKKKGPPRPANVSSASVKLVKKKDSSQPVTIQLAPVIPLPAIKEISPAVIITPALGEVDINKGPLRPAMVRPGSVPSLLGEIPLPPPLFRPEPPATFAKVKELEFATGAIPKLGPILIHPERVMELPLAPAPASPPLLVEQPTESTTVPKALPAISPPEREELPSPTNSSAPMAPTLEETVEPSPTVAAESESVPVMVMKDSPKESSVNDEAKVSVNPKPLFIPTTRTLVLVKSNPPTMCITAKRSMYIGLASIFLPFVGIVTAVMAIVLGHKALRLIRQSKGKLLGRDQATTGLCFGYITLVLIASYSTVFYFLYAPSTPSAFSAEAPTTLTFDTTIDIPAKPGRSDSLVPSSEAAPKAQNGTPMVLTPIHPTTPITSLSPGVSDNSMPPAMPPVTVATVQPVAPTQPPAASVIEAMKSQELSDKPSTTPEPTINDRATPSNPNIPVVGAQVDSQNKSGPSPASSTPANTIPAQPPAVFSFEQQNRLKNEMLALPMPYENVDSTDYRDADAFNNSARILARKPETKYAESVQDFLDDVKVRNPDHIRLQILMAMYQNYLAGLENGSSQ